jgi:hypothetical protein
MRDEEEMLLPTEAATFPNCLCLPGVPTRNHRYIAQASVADVNERVGGDERTADVALIRHAILIASGHWRIIEEKCQLQPYFARIIALKTPLAYNRIIDQVPILSQRQQQQKLPFLQLERTFYQKFPRSPFSSIAKCILS